MQTVSVFPKNFKQVIASILRPFPSADAVNEFVSLAHKVSLAYLRTKFASNRYVEYRFGISIDDLALDVIADLFARDANGKFVEFHKYFKQLDNLSELSEDELFACLRRLVFSAANVRFFKIYGELDPALSKIIRNIKLTLKNHSSVKIIFHNEENFLAPRHSKNLIPDLPLMPEELLSPEFYDRVSSKSSLRDMLAVIGNILDDQKIYKKIVHLTDVAILIKEAYTTHYTQRMMQETLSPDQMIFNDQIKSIANDVISSLENQYSIRYLEKEKLSKPEMAAIFKTTEEILINHYCLGDGDASSYFGLLQKHLRNLNKEKYTDKYRVILEYLAKMAKKGMSEILKDEMN